jgi:hypothetical protein
MILESLFGLSLVMNVSLDTSTPSANPAAWMQLSVRQKNAALLPLVRPTGLWLRPRLWTIAGLLPLGLLLDPSARH